MRKGLILILMLCVLLVCQPALADAKPELKLSGSRYTMNAEDSGTLSVSIKPEDAPMPKLVWKSSDESVLTVDENGVMSALKAGSAKVTVSAEDESAKSATCKVTVKKSKRKPINAPIEGNVYTANYGRADSETEKALRDYCEKLGDSRGEKIVRWAVERMGTPYSVMDCSKLAQKAYAANGVKISRTSAEQARDLANNVRTDGTVRVGDLFFMQFPGFRTCSCGPTCTRYRSIHHSAMYLGTVNGRTYVVDSSSHFGCVIIREFSSNTIAGMPVVCVAGK